MAAIFAHRRGKVMAHTTPAEKAADVCPDGKELGSPERTSGSIPAITS